MLWGDPSPEATIERLQAFGVAEIVVKNGPNSALVAANGARDMVPVPDVVVPVDLTAAGDGFNAGYLAARLSGAGGNRRGGRGAQARRRSDPPSRRDYAARRRRGALDPAFSFQGARKIYNARVGAASGVLRVSLILRLCFIAAAIAGSRLAGRRGRTRRRGRRHLRALSLMPPSTSTVIVCHGFGCRDRTEIVLSAADRSD